MDCGTQEIPPFPRQSCGRLLFSSQIPASATSEPHPHPQGKPLSQLFFSLLACFSDLKFTSFSHTRTYCGALELQALACAPTPSVLSLRWGHHCLCPTTGPPHFKVPAPAPALNEGAHLPNTELGVGFNKEIEQTIAIKHSALKNELISCLLTCDWTLSSSLLFFFLCSFLPDLPWSLPLSSSHLSPKRLLDIVRS